MAIFIHLFIHSFIAVAYLLPRTAILVVVRRASLS